MKQFKIICHNDLDGGASAICIINHIKYKYDSDVRYSLKFCTYSNVDNYVNQIINVSHKFEKVFIADISVSDYIAKDFPDNFILLDHHDTAEQLNEFDKCIVNTSGNHCGASLCYYHLLKKENLPFEHMKKLVAIALDYDLWHHKLPNKVAKNLNFLYYRYWGEKFVLRFINGFDGFTDEEKIYLKTQWKKIQEDIDNTEVIDLLEDEDEKYRNKIAFCKLPDRKSELNEIAEYVLNELKYEIVVIIVPRYRKGSIRATENSETKGFHVGNFNESLGIGGGHARAGGFQYIDDDHLQNILENMCEKINEYEI